jgi:hypothetical protein
MEKYTLPRRNCLEKSRGQGMTVRCSWCTLFTIERAHTTGSLTRPKTSADQSALSQCSSRVAALTKLQALPVLLVPGGIRSWVDTD